MEANLEVLGPLDEREAFKLGIAQGGLDYCKYGVWATGKVCRDRVDWFKHTYTQSTPSQKTKLVIAYRRGWKVGFWNIEYGVSS